MFNIPSLSFIFGHGILKYHAGKRTKRGCLVFKRTHYKSIPQVLLFISWDHQKLIINDKHKHLLFLTDDNEVN